MVRLTEVEDEHFTEKPAAGDETLLADDDDDFTDTDSEISDDLDTTELEDTESLSNRLYALKDIVPPKTRAKISSVTSSIFNATSTGITYGGKGLWVIATSMLLVGLPYALAFGQEQELLEEEAQRSMMAEGASGMMQSGNAGEGEARAAL